MTKVLVLSGPTGVGKTALAHSLAHVLNGELISCDSVQVYRGLVIGANKSAISAPHAAACGGQAMVPQPTEHLIDIVDPLSDAGCSFTAADFYRLCMEKISEVFSRGKLPILVGGTGFYMEWLIYGRPSAPQTDPLAMNEVTEELEADGGDWAKSIERLRQVDPIYATRLSKNDYYRLKRALCVYRQSGRPLSSFKCTQAKASADADSSTIDWRCFYLTTDRLLLLRRIDLRCEQMLRRGLIQEVVALVRAGLQKDSPAGRAIGYAECISFIERLRSAPAHKHDAELQVFIDEMQSATRQYSRKQATWFMKKKEFMWLRKSAPFENCESGDKDVLGRIKRLVEMGKKDFEKDEEIKRLSKEARDAHASINDEKSSRKAMDSYRPKLEIYSDPSARSELLQTIYPLLDIACTTVDQ